MSSVPIWGLGSEVPWLDEIQAGRAENLYVHSVHYTGALSREIAERTTEHLRVHGFVLCE
jgi:hypothetical protein